MHSLWRAKRYIRSLGE
jgi:DNA-binding transcriptional LysR family regulator